MVASYPTQQPILGKPTPDNFENDPGLEHDVLHRSVAEEIEAITAELGINPSGTYATVLARLTALTAASQALVTPADGVGFKIWRQSTAPTVAQGAADGDIWIATP